MVNEEMINSAWEQATRVTGMNPDVWRHDPCGALIKKQECGNRNSDFGWEIDHIVPRVFLFNAGASEEEINNPTNLRAMHWANNASKGMEYPEYRAVRKEVDGRNVTVNTIFTVNEELQKQLRILYGRFGI